jgi:proteic killer suppression protein
MIRSFADRETEAVYLTGRSRRWGKVARIAARRLQAIDFASAIEDLLNPPGNRLEKLKGDRKGWWSIRINDSIACASAGTTKMPGKLELLTITKENWP